MPFLLLYKTTVQGYLLLLCNIYRAIIQRSSPKVVIPIWRHWSRLHQQMRPIFRQACHRPQQPELQWQLGFQRDSTHFWKFISFHEYIFTLEFYITSVCYKILWFIINCFSFNRNYRMKISFLSFNPKKGSHWVAFTVLKLMISFFCVLL